MRRLVVVVLLAATTAACAGPAPKLTFGGKSVPVNVSFGKPAPDDPRAPTVPFVMAPALGGVGGVPVAEPRQKGVRILETLEEGPAAVNECGEHDARIAPAEEATRGLGPPPPDGDYPFRLAGTIDLQGIKGGLTRTVKNLGPQVDGTHAFTVRTNVFDVDQVWEFSTRPTLEGRVPGFVGLKSVEAVGRGMDGRPSFSTAKPLTLMPLDASDAAEFQDTTVDPTTGTTFAVTGKIIGKAQVWACGANIDTWQVKIAQRVANPLQVVTADITYWFATQYGGLIVQEAVSWTGTVGSVPFKGDYLATISKVPGT